MGYKEQLENEYNNESAKLKANKPNLMLIGASGVGKSSLLNKVFGGQFADVGAGEPVTKDIKLYRTNNGLINIFDTMGYETKYDSDTSGRCDRFENEVLAEIEKRKKLPLTEQVHIIWYCISITNHRIFSYDIEQIKNIQKTGIPLFIVFTKCDEDSENEQKKGVTAESFKDTLKEAGINGHRVFETATEGKLAFELDDLLEASCNSLTNDTLRKAFAAAQIHNIALKRDSAHYSIHLAAVAAGGAAAAPLPGADAPVITGIQIALAMKLADLYGFAILGESTLALLRSQIMSLMGKQLVASLSKLIPVVGSVINAAVAVSLTEALGWALVTVYENALRSYLETGKEPVWAQIFSADILANLISRKMEISK